MLKFDRLYNILEKWYDFQHGGCNDQTTCTIAEAYSQGLNILAIDLLVSAIGFNNENEIDINADAAWQVIKKKYNKKWISNVDSECNYLHESVNNMQCKCGAIIWQPDMCDNYCSSCSYTN